MSDLRSRAEAATEKRGTHPNDIVASAQALAAFNRAATPAEILALLDERDAHQREIAELSALIGRMYDDDPCSYDHHNYCQSHSLHERPCPHEIAQGMGLE